MLKWWSLLTWSRDSENQPFNCRSDDYKACSPCVSSFYAKGLLREGIHFFSNIYEQTKFQYCVLSGPVAARSSHATM